MEILILVGLLLIWGLYSFIRRYLSDPNFRFWVDAAHQWDQQQRIKDLEKQERRERKQERRAIRKEEQRRDAQKSISNEEENSNDAESKIKGRKLLNSWLSHIFSYLSFFILFLIVSIDMKDDINAFQLSASDFIGPIIVAAIMTIVWIIPSYIFRIFSVSLSIWIYRISVSFLFLISLGLFSILLSDIDNEINTHSESDAVDTLSPAINPEEPQSEIVPSGGQSSATRPNQSEQNRVTQPYTQPTSLVPAQLVERVVPRYPERAERHGIEGEVTFGFDIDPDGQVKNIAPVGEPPHPLLTGAGIEALRQFEYEPARNDGDPVWQRGETITFVFTLNSD